MVGGGDLLQNFLNSQTSYENIKINKDNILLNHLFIWQLNAFLLKCELLLQIPAQFYCQYFAPRNRKIYEAHTGEKHLVPQRAG